MSNVTSSDFPELVFGLVGPIGVDMASVQHALEAALRQVEYTPHAIHLTAEVPKAYPNLKSADGSELTNEQKIQLINEMRDKSRRNDFLALFSILKITELRAQINEPVKTIDKKDKETTATSRNAFIIRQLKRDEEVETLSSVYGKCFIQVSITIGEEQQRQALRAIVIQEDPSLSNEQIDKAVNSLIETDQNESSNPFGQRLSDTFQLGDVFIDGSSDKSIRQDCLRFINSFFGLNSISPTIDEFGSYMAKAASLRSIDMSRQVGSAIISKAGDIIAIGCNEVPRPGGGNYWCSDTNPQRDLDRKVEANKLETNRIIHSFVNAIHQHGSLVVEPDQLLHDVKFLDLLKETAISDITEFGRMTHAEMSAVTDAARLGLSIKDATIYVTTYPCHNCAKHLVAAGIARIVYIEPYPKSRAISLHDDSLTHSKSDSSKVTLEHFHGISPRRYRDIFEKGKRKGKFGVAKTWYETSPKPRVGERSPIHVNLEMAFLEKFDSIDLSKTEES